jgi:hypothetical protein
MVGGNREFQGSLGIRMVKVFDLIAAGTGLRDAQARKADFDPLSVTLTTLDRNSYYPGAKETILGVIIPLGISIGTYFTNNASTALILTAVVTEIIGGFSLRYVILKGGIYLPLTSGE